MAVLCRKCPGNTVLSVAKDCLSLHPEFCPPAVHPLRFATGTGPNPPSCGFYRRAPIARCVFVRQTAFCLTKIDLFAPKSLTCVSQSYFSKIGRDSIEQDLVEWYGGRLTAQPYLWKENPTDADSVLLAISATELLPVNDSTLIQSRYTLPKIAREYFSCPDLLNRFFAYIWRTYFDSASSTGSFLSGTNKPKP